MKIDAVGVPQAGQLQVLRQIQEFLEGRGANARIPAVGSRKTVSSESVSRLSLLAWVRVRNCKCSCFEILATVEFFFFC